MPFTPGVALPRLSRPFLPRATSSITLFARRLALCLVSAAAVALVGCSTSVPLPPWSPGTQAPQTGAPAPRPAGTSPSTGAQTFPVLPQAPMSPQHDGPLPYSAAVAARFAAPSLIYNTPGLQASRQRFTSQAEIQAWLAEQARAALKTPGMNAGVLTVGHSQRGQALQALILTRAASTSPDALLATKKPTVLLLSEQHGNEPAGSEALLVLARELSQGLLQPLLERINVVILPRLNPDSSETGQYASADGTDLNVDHLLLNTPETRALAQLIRDYSPTVVVDAHEYTLYPQFLEMFGALQKHDVLLQYATTANLPPFLTKAAEEWFRRPMVTALNAQGLSNEWFYRPSANAGDRKLQMGDTSPNSNRNVNGLKVSVSLLVETRGAGLGRHHIQRRVHSQVIALSSVLASTAQRASELGQLRPYLDKEIGQQACTGNMVLQAGPTAAQYDLQGLDPVTGADKTVVVDWDSTLALTALQSRPRPCGYWLAADATTAVERLLLQGVRIQRLSQASSMLADSYQAGQGAGGTTAGTAPAPMRLSRNLVDTPRGSYYVPLNQPLANLVVAALEPDTPFSFFANRLIGDLQSTLRVMAPPASAMEEL